MSEADLANITRQAGIKNAIVFTEKRAPITKQIHEFRQGKLLFPIFIIFALIFMAFEVAVIRLMR